MRRPKSQIKSLREAKGLTQRYLSQILGLSQNAYRRWEEGDTAYNIVKLILLCRLLSCKPQDLVSSPQQNTDISTHSLSGLEQLRQRYRLNSGNLIITTKVPEMLTEFRESKGITQNHILVALDISLSTLQNWEKGRVAPSILERCIKLCNILECTIEELVDYIPIAQELEIQKLLQISTVNVTKKNLQQIKSMLKTNTPVLKMDGGK